MFENWQTTHLVFLYSENGTIEFDDPGPRYKRPNDRRNINAPIGQKYCKFKTEQTLPHESGVYALFVDDEPFPVYIGKAVNLNKRWSNTNYCSISPKNVFYNGQSTNCKINHYILEKAKCNQTILLKYFCTKDYTAVENQFIIKFKPSLNVQGV